MQALFIILNDGEKIQEITHSLKDKGIRGGTILDGQGLYRDYEYKGDNPRKSGSLLMMLSQGRPLKKILLCVLPDDQVTLACDAVSAVIGDLNREGTAVAFSVPVDFNYGFTHLKED